MWNIVRSLNYMIKHDIYSYIMVLLGLTIAVSSIVTMFSDSGGEALTGSLAVGYWGNFIAVFCFMLPAFVTTRICGYDFNDKTVNYEVLYGQKRSAVFFSRIILSYIYNIILFTVLAIAPLAVLTMMNGWGHSIAMSESLFHFVLSLLVLIRYTTFIACLTFLVRSSWIGLAAGYLMMIFEMLPLFVMELTNPGFELTWQLSIPNAMKIMDFSNAAMGFVDGKDITIYKAALDSSVVTGTVLAAVIETALLLICSYALFRKRDID